MQSIDYQEKAVTEVSKKLLEHIGRITAMKSVSIKDRDILGIPTEKVVFKAPTGSGKTVISFKVMDQLTVECPSDLAFIWLAPNLLHEQAYTSFKRYKDAFSSALNPILFDDIQDNILRKNTVLCLNWDSVNKESNSRIQENEDGKFLAKIIARTKESGCELVILVDEAHIGASGATKGKSKVDDNTLLNKAKALLTKLNPVVQLNITATPKEAPDVIIERHEVVSEGVIKKAFLFNTFPDDVGKDIDLNGFVSAAYNKLLEIKAAYQQKASERINPLLIVQIENKDANNIETQRNSVTAQLIKLGVPACNIVSYLSEDIKDSTALTKLDSSIQVIFTKTAIATGWDCPRASVLLALRNSRTDDFKTQVLGRISRMPELKHYNDPLLDNAYIYSNMDKYIPASLDCPEYNGLIIQPKEVSIKEQYINTPAFSLPLFTNQDLDIKLVYDSTKYLATIKEQIGAFIVDISENGPQEVVNSIVVNLKVEDIDSPNATGENRITYNKTNSDYNRAFNSLLRRYNFTDDNHKDSFTISNKLPYDRDPLMQTVIQLLRVHLQNPNLTHYESVVYLLKNATTFEYYLKKIQTHMDADLMSGIEASTIFKGITTARHWEPPLKRVYNNTDVALKSEKNIYATEYTQKDYNTLEVYFRCFLNDDKTVAYWMKNNDSGSEYFSIPYIDVDGSLHHFYVDFIVQYIDGTIGLYDTKPSGISEKDRQKLNYLASYCEAVNKSGRDSLKLKYGFISLADTKGDEDILLFTLKDTITNKRFGELEKSKCLKD
jgi:type III restriction enzyme